MSQYTDEHMDVGENSSEVQPRSMIDEALASINADIENTIMSDVSVDNVTDDLGRILDLTCPDEPGKYGYYDEALGHWVEKPIPFTATDLIEAAAPRYPERNRSPIWTRLRAHPPVGYAIRMSYHVKYASGWTTRGLQFDENTITSIGSDGKCYVEGEFVRTSQSHVLTTAHFVCGAKMYSSSSEKYIRCGFRNLGSRTHKANCFIRFVDERIDIAILEMDRPLSLSEYPIDVVNEGIPDVNNGAFLFTRDKGKLYGFGAVRRGDRLFFIGDDSFRAGASGAPVLNENGEVLAIVVAGSHEENFVEAVIVGDVNRFTSRMPVPLSFKRFRPDFEVASLPTLEGYIPLPKDYQKFTKKKRFATKVSHVKRMGNGGSDVYEHSERNAAVFDEFERFDDYDLADIEQAKGAIRKYAPEQLDADGTLDLVPVRKRRADGSVVQAWVRAADAGRLAKDYERRMETTPLAVESDDVPALEHDYKLEDILNALSTPGELKGKLAHRTEYEMTLQSFKKYLKTENVEIGQMVVDFPGGTPAIKGYKNWVQLTSSIFAVWNQIKAYVAVFNEGRVESMEHLAKEEQNLARMAEAVAAFEVYAMVCSDPDPSYAYNVTCTLMQTLEVPNPLPVRTEKHKSDLYGDNYWITANLTNVSMQFRAPKRENPALARAKHKFPEVAKYHFAEREDKDVAETLRVKSAVSAPSSQIPPAARAAAIEKIVAEIPPVHDDFLRSCDLPTTAQIWDAIVEINSKANDSYPGSLTGLMKKEFAEENFAFICYSVWSFFYAWGTVSEEIIKLSDPLDLYYRGMAFLSTVAPKLEVIKVGKSTRLIFRAAAAAEVVKRLLFDKPFASMKDEPGSTFSMIGFSPNEVYRDILYALPGPLAKSDVTAMDYAKTLQDKLDEAEIHIRQARGISSFMERVIRGVAYSDAHSLVILPDGVTLEKVHPGTQNSGEFDTSIGNTYTRAIWGYSAHEVIRALYDTAHEYGVRNASDDAVETDHRLLEWIYHLFGLPIRDYEAFDEDTPIEFCSHIWPRDSRPYPVRIWKSLYKLAAGGYPPDQVADFVREFSGHPEFENVRAFIYADPAFMASSRAAREQ